MGTSPTNSRRACLCKNGTYSKCCCKGDLINQGIGSLGNHSTSTTVNETTPNTVTNISNDTNL